MNSSQIKSFLAAAKHLNFTNAANSIYLSQPVLSRQISSLEEELNLKLFFREKKTIRLTPAGKIMYDGFSRMKNEYDALIDYATAIDTGYYDCINIGMTAHQLILPPFSDALSSFRSSYPNVRVNLSSHTISGLYSALLNEEIDIAFTSAKFKNLDESILDYIEVGSIPNMMVVPSTHPFANRKNLVLDDFKDEVFLTLSPEDYIFLSTDIQTYFKDNEVFNEKKIMVPDIGVLSLWIEAGYGISPMNYNHVLRNNPNFIFLPVDGLQDTIETVVWKKNNVNEIIDAVIRQFN